MFPQDAARASSESKMKENKCENEISKEGCYIHGLAFVACSNDFLGIIDENTI